MDQQSVQSTNQSDGTPMPEEIRAFLESLLIDSGVTTLDESGKEEMMKELYSRLDTFLTAKLVDNLPPDKLEDFIQMNNQGKGKPEVEDFLKTNITNFNEVFTDAFIEFRDLYLGKVSEFKDTPQETQPANADQTTS